MPCPDAMGDAVRGPDANRYGMWGQGRMGAACRGDPTGRPYVMGNARNGRRGACAPTRTGTVCGGRAEWVRHVGATQRVAPTQWATHAMGDAVRGPDANRYGMWGQGRMGTACRGDPTGRPYAMGNARNGRRGAVPRREPVRYVGAGQNGHGM